MPSVTLQIQVFHHKLLFDQYALNLQQISKDVKE